MKILKQKYHGLPGLGINGKTGDTGKKARSIYFGYINDFFDGTKIPIGTYVYAAKRMFNHLYGEESQDDISTLKAAWQVTLDELSHYNSDTLSNAVLDTSLSQDSSYIKYSTFYYTGNRLTDDSVAMAEGILQPTTIEAAKSIKLDLTGDFISMSFMLSSLDKTLPIEPPELYKTEKDISVGPFGDDPTISNMYNIINEVNVLVFDNNAQLNLNIPNVEGPRGRIFLPYDSNDAVYDSSAIAGIAYENGTLLDNINYSDYYEIYPENTLSFNYVKDKNLPYYDATNAYFIADINDAVSKLSLSKATIDYNTSGGNNHYLIQGYEGDGSTNGQWNLIYKTSSKKEKISDYYTEGDLLNSEGQANYGLAPSLLYVNRGGSNVDINYQELYKISDKAYNEFLEGGKTYSAATLTAGGGTYVYYSLDDNDNYLFVPSTLKDEFCEGDVLYFYTNVYDFENISNPNYQNILYMAVLTDDLLGCTPTELIYSALLASPLDIRNLMINSRVQSYNNNAVLLNDASGNNNIRLSNKSFIGITDNYVNSAAIIASRNNNGSNVSNGLVTLNAMESADTSAKIFVEIINDEVNINTSSLIKINNFGININAISDKTNIEVAECLYMPYIKLYDNNFIKPLIDIDLYTNSESLLIFAYIAKAADYFYNVESLSNYFYGCDIYNSKFEKINTITSSDSTLNIKLIPNIENDTYYIQMFASFGSSIKYFSKFTKLSISYKKYERSFKKDSYLIDSYKIDIIGDDQNIIKNKLSENITFDLANISAEASTNIPFIVYTDNASVKISKVLFNHDEIVNTWNNSWCNIAKGSITDSSCIYSLNLNSNLPKFDSSTVSVNTIDEYVKLGYKYNENSQESRLFEILSNDSTALESKQRSVLVTVEYYLDDQPNEFYYENYNIVQPGFTDTRNVPNFELKSHVSMADVQSYNSLDNGVLSNQFVTYVDINIKDFKKQWGTFTKNNDIFLDCSITNIDYDLNWQNNYIVQSLTERRTFKTILEDVSVNQLNNYVKISAFVLNTKDNLLTTNTAKCCSTSGNIDNGGEFSVTQDFILYNKSNNQNEKIQPKIIDDYIVCDTSFINVNRHPEKIYCGLLDNIILNLEKIPITDDIDTIKLKLLVEMGNPMLANLYLRFVVSNVAITVHPKNSGDNIENDTIFKTSVPETFAGNTRTYLANSYTDADGAKSIIRINYTFISDPIDIMFNPISYIVCPQDAETSYTNIYSDGDFKYGIRDQIKKELKFFNASIYENNPFNYGSKEIRENFYYPFNNLYIKKSYILDNIKSINVVPTSLYVLVDNINKTLDVSIDNSLDTHNVLDFIEGNKYLSVVYHSLIMQPKIRNDVYNFYYNNYLYLRNKYNLKIDNMPVFIHDSQSLTLRDDDLINSMDKWNDYYTESVKYEDAKTYQGILSLYGNGYTQLLENDIKDVSFNGYMSCEDVVALNDVSINLYSLINEVNVKPTKSDEPNTGEYFRGFLYNINWEFPYYDKDNDLIIPYRIVSPFDNLLNNIDVPEIYQDYYDALIEKDEDKKLYGKNMVPYTLLYNINPRVAFNYETSGINVLMLRRPSIGIDTDIINNADEFKEKYEFNRQLFDLTTDIEKLSSPYIIKSNKQ